MNKMILLISGQDCICIVFLVSLSEKIVTGMLVVQSPSSVFHSYMHQFVVFVLS